MSFKKINEAIYGISGDIPSCDNMAALIGRFFDCDYVFTFMYNKRGNHIIEKIYTGQQVAESALDLSIIRSEINKSDPAKAFFLDEELTGRVGLGQSFRVMVVHIPENSYTKGAIAITKKSGINWEPIDLERFETTVMLITKCYELNMSLADSQQYVNTILESINTAIFAISKDGTMVHFNKAAEKIFGCRADWAVGKHYFMTMSQKEKEKMRSGFDYVMKTGNSFSGHFIEMTLLNNRVIYLNPRICPWVNSDGEIIGAIGIMTDETENKYFQDQLVRAEKMAILGQIAAQVSHDVLNPLASIRGFARLIEKNKPAESKYNTYAKTIVEQVDRVDNVIRELLDFSRPYKLKIEKVDINKTVKNAVDQKKIINDAVTIVEEYEQDLPLIDGDLQKIERIFENLLQNAYQSIEESGLIEIRTFLSPDKHVTVTLRDSGCGIPRQYLNKIYDPYFTTKDNGTGLGLAIVQQIVKSHGAKIRIQSDLGIGTCFTLEFPSRKGKDDE